MAPLRNFLDVLGVFGGLQSHLYRRPFSFGCALRSRNRTGFERFIFEYFVSKFNEFFKIHVSVDFIHLVKSWFFIIEVFFR